MPRKTSFFDNMYRTFRDIVPFIPFIFLARFNYYRDVSDSMRMENHIPCIDSNMRLKYRTKSIEIWRSKEFRTDTIWRNKEIDIDMFGIYSETDHFINVPKDQTVVIETRVPNLFRSRRVHYKLLPTSDYFKSKKVENVRLDSLQVDSIMKSWGYVINYDCK